MADPRKDESVDSILARARACEYTSGALREFGLGLSKEDPSAIDRALERGVAERDEVAFTHLLIAALGGGHPVDARHLVGGAALFIDPAQLAAAAMRCSGDVPGALLSAVAGGRMGWEREASALLLAGLWCREKARPFPPDIIAQARTLARRTVNVPMARIQLLALATVLKDPGLDSILDGGDDRDGRMASRLFIEGFLRFRTASVFETVPEDPREATIYREAPQVGRNDPCPCGSGKKYKKCCFGREPKALPEARPRSEPPSAPPAKPRGQIEAALTVHRLAQLRSHELARLDPTRMSPDLLPVLINQLVLYHEFEAAVRVFERVGLREEIRGHWQDVLSFATMASRLDLIERLMKHRPEGEDGELDFHARFLLAEDGKSPLLEMIEAEAMRALESGKPQDLIDLGYSLLESRYPALGILAARGILPISRPLDAWALLQTLLEARDKLNLSPDDPIEDILDRLSLSEQAYKEDPEALSQERSRLEAKAEEVRKLQAEIAALRSKLPREPALASPTPEALPAAAAGPPAEDRGVADLKRRLAALRADLKERHMERNDLRRELEKARADLEELRKKDEVQAAKSIPQEDLTEEAMLLGEETIDRQDVRVPVFPARFMEMLQEAPPPVARGALVLIGRLAAGEAAAFRGVRRLERDRTIWRQRVGLWHRLLFRMDGKALEVLTLIQRRDLERAVRSLARG